MRDAGCTVRHDEMRAQASWRGYLAGEDDARATELVDALTEPGVDVVWMARGGSGAARVAEQVVERLRDAPPRALVGYSDATTLLNGLATQLGWITFHGPVVTSLGRPDPSCDLTAVLATLRGERTSLPFTPNGDADGCRAGPQEGRLYGGNLTVLASLAGTALWPDAPSVVWVIEEVGEPPYRIDRCFWQLRACGALDGAAAVWLGDLGVSPEERAGCIDALRQDAGDVPVVEGAPAGHRGAIDLLPIGARVRLDFGDRQLHGLEPFVARS